MRLIVPRIRRSCCPVSKMFGRPSVARNLRDIATEPETEEGRLGHIGVATGPRRHLVDLRLPRSESPACWLMCLFSHPFGLRGRTVGSPAAQRPRRRRPHQRSTTERTWPSTPQRRSSSSSRQALNPTRGEPEPCMQSCTRANSMKSAPRFVVSLMVRARPGWHVGEAQTVRHPEPARCSRSSRNRASHTRSVTTVPVRST